MHTIFMNSEKSKTFDPHITHYYSIFQGKHTSRKVINMLLYQIVAFTRLGKI